MMRIGLDARNVTDRASGLVGYVRNLVEQLITMDVELVLFCQERYQTVFSDAAARSNCRLVFVPHDNTFLSRANLEFEQSKFPAVITAEQLDLFHNPYGFGVPAGLSCPVLLTIHDLIPLVDEDALSPEQVSIFTESFERSAAAANHIVTISQFTKDELMRLYPSTDPTAVTVIYDGFDRLDVLPDRQQRRMELLERFDITEPYLLYVGSGTRRKNLPYLADAYVEAVAKGFDRQLVIVSKFDRPETQASKAAIEDILKAAGLSGRARFPGYLADADKAAIMEGCELFVYPSRYEGFGLPILEAMSLQRPVICSDIPPFHEIAGDAVRYCDRDDPSALAQQLIELANDPALRQQLVDRSEKQLKKFSWSQMAAGYEVIYRQLATSR